LFKDETSTITCCTTNDDQNRQLVVLRRSTAPARLGSQNNLSIPIIRTGPLNQVQQALADNNTSMLNFRQVPLQPYPAVFTMPKYFGINDDLTTYRSRVFTGSSFLAGSRNKSLIFPNYLTVAEFIESQKITNTSNLIIDWTVNPVTRTKIETLEYRVKKFGYPISLLPVQTPEQAAYDLIQTHALFF
jgi:hypothetical protein